MKKLYFLLLLVLGAFPVISQDKDRQYQDPQNIPVEPENTDCHELPETFEDLQQALSALLNTRFYYDQSLKTTRKSGLMSARFLSCDFKEGYLLVRYNGQDQVYPNVETQLWEQFQQTADIDGFYFKHIENLPKVKAE